VVNKDLYDALAAELGLTEGSPAGGRSPGRR